MVNIGLVIAHFSSKILNEKTGDGAAVLARIEKEAVVWPTDRLKKFPELKFRYRSCSFAGIFESRTFLIQGTWKMIIPWTSSFLMCGDW